MASGLPHCARRHRTGCSVDLCDGVGIILPTQMELVWSRGDRIRICPTEYVEVVKGRVADFRDGAVAVICTQIELLLGLESKAMA